MIGQHADLLMHEDRQSQNLAAAEPWWEPRHRADVPVSFPETPNRSAGI